MAIGNPDAVLARVRERIISQSLAKGRDVSGWFADNASRLALFARLLATLAKRAGYDQTLPGSAQATAASVLATAEQRVAARNPAQGEWFARNRNFLSLVATLLLSGRGEAQTSPSAVQRPSGTPAPAPAPSSQQRASPITTPEPSAGDLDETDPSMNAERTAANVEALQVLSRLQKSGAAASPREVAQLRRFTGFGGLSLKKVADKLPPELVPDERALIHEYYTPSKVAKAIGQALKSRLPLLRDERGIIEALEPSAGTGRLLSGLSGDGFDGISWRAVDYSSVSAALLRATRPDVSVFEGPFEQWVIENPELEGRINLVVSNPPYGERGKAQFIDPDRSYRVKRAYVYQMLRATDYLAPHGIGVFLIPAGFMTGKSPAAIETRRRVLSRNHLMAAFRLPSETESGVPLFPGALLVVDLVFLRSRGGALANTAEEDEFIAKGDYFVENPANILGREAGKEAGDDVAGKKPRFGYQVVGNFEVLPDFQERPACRDCVTLPIRREKRDPKKTIDLPEPVREAIKLARVVSGYLADIARNEPESIRRASEVQQELKDALLAWSAQDPADKLAIAAAIKVAPELQALFTALGPKGKGLLAAIDNPPAFERRFIGDAEDIGGIAEFLHGSKQDASVSAVTALHRELGGLQGNEEVKFSLIQAGFAFEGDRVIPSAEYYTGLLWPKYDLAKAASATDAIAAGQAAGLLDAIKPVSYAEISVEPRLGWLRPSVLTEFFNSYVNTNSADSARYTLERNGALLTLAGIEYENVALSLSKPALELLGYLNHDMVYFRPKVKRNKDEDLEKVRLELANKYKEAFINWLETRPDLQRIVAEDFNRLFRGWVEPKYSTDPLSLYRWNKKYPLYPYQAAGARRLLANHGGGLFFDVGLGKTRTMLATLAGARQQGWARRAAIVMPNSVIFNWVAEQERVLPDYRVVLIGVKRKTVQRGARKGTVESEADTPRERADKWQRFKAGLYDVAFITYSALGRTKMRYESLVEVVRKTPALQREIGFKLRNAEARIKQLSEKSFRRTEAESEELEALRDKYGGKKLSERREAVEHEKEEEFVGELLELPKGHEFDPDIDWEDLGIDWLAFDEAHTGKNLWTIGAREGGVPKFLGAPQEGSAIAYQMFFRAALVRKRAGGTGIFLADATPEKNSPLEFLSLLSFLDDKLWERLGIFDAEQYLTQYLRIEIQLILDSDLSPAELPCVVGFKNLDQLREVLFRYGEFQTAKSVGLKVPEADTIRIDLDLDEAQEEKYRDYLSQYTLAIADAGRSADSRFKALGLLQRMSLVAVHAELDEGPWSFGNASGAKSYTSPKIEEIARIVAKRKDCGHLIFFENNAVHWWLRERLIANGLPRERIAILNGDTTPNTLARQQIAEGFTAEEAAFDIVIANKIAYEGLNLQTRTCAIYHGDLPYEPATLQQRNGRGLRQGNRYDIIAIYYVLCSRSMDMGRFQLIQGKREWLSEIIESAASETNNPAAQANLSPDEWLIYLSRDKAATELLIAEKRAAQTIEQNKRAVKIAWSNVRGIAMRHRDMVGADLILRTQLSEGISELADDLTRLDPEIWPWKFMVSAIMVNPVLSFAPSGEGAIWETARYLRRDSNNTPIDGAEFGRVLYSPLSIGYRRLGEFAWSALALPDARAKWELTRPDDWKQEWPQALADEVEEEAARFIRRLADSGVYVYREGRFDLATEDFRRIAWDRWGLDIVKAIGDSRYNFQARVPYLVGSTLSADGENISAATFVFPFTAEGYQHYLSAAQGGTELKWTDLDAISEWWWGRGIPRNLLAQNREKQAA